jgi:hypothetical protein
MGCDGHRRFKAHGPAAVRALFFGRATEFLPSGAGFGSLVDPRLDDRDLRVPTDSGMHRPHEPAYEVSRSAPGMA